MQRLSLASLVITAIAVLTAVGSRSVDNAQADATGVAVAPSTVFVQPNE